VLVVSNGSVMSVESAAVSSVVHEVADAGAGEPNIGGRGRLRDELGRLPLHGGFGGPEARFEALKDRD
jgi:hypothetical protein